MNIRTTLSAPAADIERCAGRCDIAAKSVDGGEVWLDVYLEGCADALRSLLEMEYGMDEDSFLNKVTMRYRLRNGEVRDE